METGTALALAAAGVASGFINAVAGGGSSISLPVLEWSTGSPTLANATNRVAVLLQNVAAAAAFQTGRRVPWRLSFLLVLPMLLGSTAGAWAAASLDVGAMRVALVAGVLFAAATALLPQPTTPRLSPPWRELAFFFCGAYAGFLQVGVGFLLLACLVGGLGLDLVRANGAKVTIVLFAMLPAVAIFWQSRLIVWDSALVLGAGNMGGAWIAARLAIQRGERWIRFVVAGAAVAATVKLLFFPSGPR
ncbi:MAG: sulfite exporter TauE/SafE family protein [Planctomycetaceae bacterium]